jgi:hypothetical protein
MMFLEPKTTIDHLVQCCKAGQRKAQELLYKQFASKMLGFVCATLPIRWKQKICCRTDL